MPKNVEPENADYCRVWSCSHLTEADKCDMGEGNCIHNHKYLKYWEAFGELSQFDTEEE